MPNYDYIIIGAGASGLLLADAMGKDNFFDDKTILILDKSAKTTKANEEVSRLQNNEKNSVSPSLCFAMVSSGQNVSNRKLAPSVESCTRIPQHIPIKRLPFLTFCVKSSCFVSSRPGERSGSRSDVCSVDVSSVLAIFRM